MGHRHPYSQAYVLAMEMKHQWLVGGISACTCHDMDSSFCVYQPLCNMNYSSYMVHNMVKVVNIMRIQV